MDGRSSIIVHLPLLVRRFVGRRAVIIVVDAAIFCLMAPFNYTAWRCSLSMGVKMSCNIVMSWLFPWLRISVLFGRHYGREEEGLLLLDSVDAGWVGFYWGREPFICC